MKNDLLKVLITALILLVCLIIFLFVLSAGFWMFSISFQDNLQIAINYLLLGLVSVVLTISVFRKRNIVLYEKYRDGSIVEGLKAVIAKTKGWSIQEWSEGYQLAILYKNKVVGGVPDLNSGRVVCSDPKCKRLLESLFQKNAFVKNVNDVQVLIEVIKD